MGTRKHVIRSAPRDRFAPKRLICERCKQEYSVVRAKGSNRKYCPECRYKPKETR